jgi:hypothetical protein
MAKQTINIGTAPNDGTGTPLRTSFDYCNQNFTELYTATGPSGNNIVVPGSATISGDLTVATSALKVTGGKVGIGTASPAYELDVSSATASNQLRLSGSNQNSITFANAAAGASNGFLVGRSFSSDDANNWFIYDVTSAALRFFIGGTGNVGIGTAAPTEAVDLNSGNVKLGNGNVILSTSGKGIDFSATASGSGTMTSELLADYEEGTWTPAFTFATPGTLALTYNLQSGSYTKIGRLVTVIFRVSFAAGGIIKGTASGNLSITGLPFTVGSSNVYQYVDLGSSITDITTGSFALITATGTSIVFETMSTSGTRIQRDSAGLTAASFAASNAGFITISGTFTYFV